MPRVCVCVRSVSLLNVISIYFIFLSNTYYIHRRREDEYQTSLKRIISSLAVCALCLLCVMVERERQAQARGFVCWLPGRGWWWREWKSPGRKRERTCYRTCEKKEEEQEPPLGSPKDRNQLVSTQCRSFCTWSGHFLIAFLFKDQVFLLLDARDYYYYEVKGAGNSTQ
jgi:hypothetical protein